MQWQVMAGGSRRIKSRFLSERNPFDGSFFGAMYREETLQTRSLLKRAPLLRVGSIP